MAIVRRTSGARRLLATLLCAMVLAPGARAAVAEIQESYLDDDDWLEQHGYNPERDLIIEIGNWNRREIEGYWPEVEYSYYDWLEVSEYYEEDEN